MALGTSVVLTERIREAVGVQAADAGTRLEAAVLATLTYYDLLDLPLTAVECWRYLLRQRGTGGTRTPTLHGIEGALSSLVSAGELQTRHGFHFFPGREALVTTRIEKHAQSQLKWRRLRRIAWWLQIVPFLRGVAVTGSLAFDNAKPTSDLDVLIIAASNRVWTVRFFLTIILDLFRLRRRPQGETRDRVCLNHYLSQDALGFPFRSLYTAMEYARLVPLLGETACREFRAANRAWMAEYLVRVFPDTVTHRKTLRPSRLLRLFQASGEVPFSGRLGDRLEKLLAAVQQARIARAEATTAPGGRVVATSARAEFHPYSREAPLLAAFNRRVGGLGLAASFGSQHDSGLTI